MRGLRFSSSRNPEVSQYRCAVLSEQDIGGFNIPMHHAPLMRVFQRPGDGFDDLDGRLKGEALLDSVVESTAGKILDSQEKMLVFMAVLLSTVCEIVDMGCKWFCQKEKS